MKSQGPSFGPAVNRVNRAFEVISNALKKYHRACSSAGHPVKGLTFAVLGNGGVHIKVRYAKSK